MDDDQQLQQQRRDGVIRSHMEFAEAAANGSRAMVTSWSCVVLLRGTGAIDSVSLSLARSLADDTVVGLAGQVEFLLDNGVHIDTPGKGA